MIRSPESGSPTEHGGQVGAEHVYEEGGRSRCPFDAIVVFGHGEIKKGYRLSWQDAMEDRQYWGSMAGAFPSQRQRLLAERYQKEIPERYDANPALATAGITFDEFSAGHVDYSKILPNGVVLRDVIQQARRIPKKRG